jgi:hypothetical protein
MASSFDYLEGRRFCVVFVKVVDPLRERVALQCFRGRASIERGRVNVVADNGGVFALPGTALPNILPSDGSSLLKDAEYFCLVKTDENIELMSAN